MHAATPLGAWGRSVIPLARLKLQNESFAQQVKDMTSQAAVMTSQFAADLQAGAARRLCPPHTPKGVTYHEQSHYCRFMIGHGLGRMDISYFLTTFPRLHEVVSLHMCVLPSK